MSVRAIEGAALRLQAAVIELNGCAFDVSIAAEGLNETVDASTLRRFGSLLSFVRGTLDRCEGAYARASLRLVELERMHIVIEQRTRKL